MRPCNLKRQQRDLMPVLRRPVEPAGVKPTYRTGLPRSEFDPERVSCGAREQAEEPLNPFDVRGSDDASPFVDIGHDASFELIAAGRPRIVAQRFEPLDCRRFRQNIGYHAV